MFNYAKLKAKATVINRMLTNRHKEEVAAVVVAVVVAGEVVVELAEVVACFRLHRNFHHL